MHRGAAGDDAVEDEVAEAEAEALRFKDNSGRHGPRLCAPHALELLQHYVAQRAARDEHGDRVPHHEDEEDGPDGELGEAEEGPRD